MITTRIDGSVGHIVIDMPGRSMNVLTFELAEALDQALSRILADEAVQGIVLSSAKPAFMAGADLAQMNGFARPQVSAAEALAMIERYSRVFRRIETCGRPVVAAASGTALGAGLELMLCCHYRIAADQPKAQFGLPEVGLGLLPGLGGTQRLPRLIGIAQALPILTRGTPLTGKAALDLGLLHELVPPERLLAAAVEALGKGRVQSVAPWDQKGYKLPGGDAFAAANANALTAANASTHAATKGNYPAPEAILRAVYEGSRLPIDQALKLEQQLFVTIVRGSVAQNMIQTLFFARQGADKLARRPAGIEKSTLGTLGILGAGFMGAGIAQVAAGAGIRVILLDRDLATARRAHDGIREAVDAEVTKGRRSAGARDELLERIEASEDYAALARCDLLIEAVPEDFALKKQVTRAAERHLRADAVFASNTSALPIEELGLASARAENFIGLHFFSPVSRMALVEVITARATSARTLARALDFIQQIRKTPIIVRDGYGFYTTRCVEAYIREGTRLLAEGADPALIENAGTLLGMPVGPLALADEVGIDVLHHIVHFFRDRERGRWADDKHWPGNGLIDRLYGEHRYGRKTGRGFYEYAPAGTKRLDRALAAAAGHLPVSDMKERLLYAQVVEAARCWADGVVDDAGEADLGAHLGWAFPSYLGGPFRYVDQIGVAKFVECCAELTERHGARFEPPEKLSLLAAAGGSLHAGAP